MIIANEIKEVLNGLFDLDAFLHNKDYRKNKWFVDKNWNTIVIDFFSLNENSTKTNQLFALFPESICLTSMPFNSSDLEGKIFDSGLDFIEDMTVDDTFAELEYYSWTIFNEALDIILIFEADDEAFYLGYHKKHEPQVQHCIINSKLVLPYEEYIQHSKNLDKLFKKK